MGGAWLCTHLWDHYTYTMDKVRFRFFFFFFFKLIKNTLLLVYHWSENVFLLIGRLLKNTFQIGRICWYLLMNPVLALQKKKKKNSSRLPFALELSKWFRQFFWVRDGP
jgi:hypothetical protein